MKDEPPLRVPDPSATIPDFGPRPDLSKAPNLAALMGGPSPMATPDDKGAAPKPPASRNAPKPPKPPVSKAAKQTPQVEEAEEGNGPNLMMFLGASIVLTLLAGALAFSITLLIGLAAVLYMG